MRDFAFGSGNPDPGSFPWQGLIDAAAKILPQVGESLVLYPDQKGYRPLRELASERFRKNNGMELPVDNIALTAGSMQAISLICQAFLKPGDTILVEEYCYVGSLNCFRKFEANMVGVKIDNDGMNIDDLEAKLADLTARGIKPKFVYVIASNQNPTGTMMPESRRRRLVDVAKKYDVLVVDDDCYADLLFEGAAPPSIYSIDPESGGIYIGSFSKILGPGVRLGFFAAKEELLQKVLFWKIDGGTSNFSAAVAAEYFKDHMWDHVGEINGIVKEKLDLIKEGLSAHPQSFLSYSNPVGGLFIWIKLPDDVDPVRLQQLANERGIRYGTGKSFHTKNEDIRYLRLAFGYVSHDDIRDGLPILAECVQLARSIPVPAAT
ncbi:MAG TPA: PLP-dependent aminotransferase family protein [Dehalococcoidia bacterium]|nr:PLP-dependent aminotransferase family protein [Dehalococcoidia bacterium]